ncbi:hypothetical protein [Desulfobotulus alkaliphilus]|uniref:hypothetical protein n=1 Tax=Desulfobotulus alkaliphilus TaxID=622671 RepID=UPI00119FD3A4|nr:hypothetical protein [Desulfobotulus alkaliphilus]
MYPDYAIREKMPGCQEKPEGGRRRPEGRHHNNYRRDSLVGLFGGGLKEDLKRIKKTLTYFILK